MRGCGRGGGGPGGKGGDRRGDARRAPILELAKYVGKKVRVKFMGGREITGTLKGYDQLLNLVLDDVEEVVRNPETLVPVAPAQLRQLGLIIVRGTSLIVLNPADGFEQIENPFAQVE